jgi:hypothetical protein
MKRWMCMSTVGYYCCSSDHETTTTCEGVLEGGGGGGGGGERGGAARESASCWPTRVTAHSLLQLPLCDAPRSSASSPPSPSPRSRGRRRRRVHSPPMARCPLAKQVSARYLLRSPASLSRSSSYLSAPLAAAPLRHSRPSRPRWVIRFYPARETEMGMGMGMMGN